MTEFRNTISRCSSRKSRYSDIKSCINAGPNLQKHLEKMEEIRRFYKFRPDEIFRRISILQLVRLIVETEKLRIQEEEQKETEKETETEKDIKEEEQQQMMMMIKPRRNENNSEIGKEKEFKEDKNREINPSFSSKFNTNNNNTNNNNIISCYERLQENQRNSITISSPPYILLDIRDPEEFKDIPSIITAQNYPARNLSKAFNYETSSMLRIKNKFGKILVIVDNDESIAPKFTTTLFQRGYDNVFMLSGGLQVAKMKFPERICVSNVEHLNTRDIVIIEEYIDDALRVVRSGVSTPIKPIKSSLFSTPQHRR